MMIASEKPLRKRHSSPAISLHNQRMPKCPLTLIIRMFAIQAHYKHMADWPQGLS